MAVEKISVEVQSNAKKIEKELSDIDDRIKKLKNSKATIELRAEKLKNAKDEINKIELQLRQLTAKKASIKADANVKDAKSKIDALNLQMNKLRERKATLQVTTHQLKGADRDLNNLHKEMTRLNNRKAQLQLDKMDVQMAENQVGKLKNKLTELGSSKTKIDVSSNINELGSKLDSIGSKILNPFASKVNQIIGIGALLKGVDAAVNMVTGSIGGAIDRYDIVQNYPTIMSNMNISAKDSQKSIDTLKEKLTGLPTTLDDSIVAVQRFTSKNKDINKSTNQFLALNNAILAGKANTQIQASALEQLAQAYSKGSMDMMEWRTLQMAMPAQVDQVAQAMNMSADALGEGMRKGDISIESFMDKIEELNTKGVNGFKSFEEQAKNAVSGLRTGMAVMRSAVVRGIESIIGSIDTMLEKAGLGGFAGVMSKIGSTFESSFKKIGSWIENNQENIAGFFDRMKSIFADFDKKMFFKGLNDSFSETVKSGKKFMNFARPFVDFAKNMITKLGDGSFERGLGRLPGKILQIGIASKIAGKGLKLFSGPLGKLFSSKLFGRSSSLPTTLEAFKGNMFDGLISLGKKAGQLATLYGTFKVVEAAVDAMKKIDKDMPSDFNGLAKKFGAMATGIFAMQGVMIACDKIAKMTKTTMVSGLLTIVAISGGIIAVSVAIDQMNKRVKGNVASIGKKMLLIAEAIGAFGLISMALGALMSSGLPALMMGSGIATVLALSAGIASISVAIKKLEQNVPANSDEIIAKLKSLVKVFDYMRDHFTASFQEMMSALGGYVETKAIGGTINTIIDIVKSIQRLQEMDVYIDSDKITTLLKNIKVVAEAIQEDGDLFINLNNALKAWAVGFEMKVVNNALDKIVKLGEALTKLSDKDISFNSNKITSMVKKIRDVSDSLYDGQDIVKNLAQAVEAWSEKKKVQNIQKAFEAIQKIAMYLSEISQASPEINLTKIEKVVTASGKAAELILNDEGFGSFTNGTQGSKNLATIIKNVKNVVAAIKEMALDLEAMSVIKLDQKKITKAMDTVGDVIAKINNAEIQDVKPLDEKTRENISKTIDMFVYVGNKAKEIKAVKNAKKIEKNIESIKKVLTKFSFKKGDTDNLLSDKDINKVNHTMDLFIGMLGKFQQLNVDLQLGKVGTTINELKKNIGLLSFGDNKGEVFKRLLSDKDIDKVNHTMDLFIGMMNRMKELNVDIQLGKVGTTINELKKNIGLLSFGEKKDDIFSRFLTDGDIKKVNHAVDLFIGMMSRMKELNQEVKLTKVGDTITELKTKIGMLAFGDKKDKLFNNFLNDSDITKVNHAMDLFIGMRDRMKELNKKSNLDKVVQTITDLKIRISSLSFGDKKDKLFGGFLNDGDITLVNHGVDLFVGMLERMKALNKTANLEKVAQTITDLKIKMSMLAFGDKKDKLFSNFLTDDNINSVNHATDLFVGMIERLQKLNIDVNLEKVGQVINTVKEKIGLMSFGKDKGNMVKNMLADKDVEKINYSIAVLGEMIQRFQNLNIDLDLSKAEAAINNIKGKISLLSFGKDKGDMVKNMVTEKDITKINRVVDLFIGLKDRFQHLNIDLNLEKVGPTINEVKRCIGLLTFGDRKGDLLKSMLNDSDIAGITKALDFIIALMQKLQPLNQDVDYTLAGGAIDKLKLVLGKLSFGEKKFLAGVLTETDISLIDRSLDALARFRDKANSLASTPLNKEAIFAEIQKVKDVINELSTFPSAKGMESIEGLVTSFEKLVDTLNAISGKFQAVGLNYGKEIIKGFNKSNIPRKMVSTIDKAIASLNAKQSAFQAIGDNYARALTRGFAASLADNMERAIHAQLINMNNQSSAFGIVGSNFGKMLASSFSTQISNLASDVGEQLQQIQREINSVSGPDISARSSSGSSGSSRLPTLANDSFGTIGRAKGGPTSTKYLSEGGETSTGFVPKGKDVIPAMLAHGEFVQRKAAHQKFGTDFMERVNNLDIHGVFNSLTSRFNLAGQMQPSVSTVVNNISHTSNNNAKLNQYFSGNGDQGSGFRRANRYIRGLRG